MARITLRYFAAAAEAAGREQEEREFEGPLTLAVLRAELVERYGTPMAKVVRAGSFLVDGRVRRDDGPLAGSGADAVRDRALRVDVLPPFAGG